MSANRRPLVVVGAGVAGLSVALSAAPRDVVLLDLGGLSSSCLAQGGIAAALAAGDDVEAHLADTLAAGSFHNDAALVRTVLAAAPDAIAWLQTMGVTFDRDAEGLQLGREGGHRRPRIVHAGGDRTGDRVVAALRERVDAAGHVQWHRGVAVEALLMRGRAAAGVQTRNPDGGAGVIESEAVVLATGGLGALYERSTNPAGSMGAGIALALAASAQMRDMEFMQFHPTALDAGGARLPLVTEALRGAGARLLDHRGEPLMRGLHPLGDLAPRDVVARRVWQVQRHGPVWLDATALHVDWNRAFPTVLATCRAHGIDPRVQPIPVTAAAHFHMGGIATDALGRSSVPRLYAAGEVACNRLHGANRLASNSLLEGVVCGRRLGMHLRQRTPRSGRGAFRLAGCGPALEASPLATLRRHLWSAAGPVRNQVALATASREVADMANAGWQAHVARSVLDAALHRTESLGAHWREDS